MWPIVLEELKKQGFSFLLLAAAVWYFHTENLDLRKSVNACNEKQLERYESNEKEMIRVMMENTRTMKEIQKVIQEK